MNRVAMARHRRQMFKEGDRVEWIGDSRNRIRVTGRVKRIADYAKKDSSAWYEVIPDGSGWEFGFTMAEESLSPIGLLDLVVEALEEHDV